MIKTFVAILGVLILITSISLKKSIESGLQFADSVNSEETSYGIIEGPLPCKWEVTPPESVITENKSISILISTSNDMDEECQTQIYLRAPNFDISPSSDTQKIALNATSSGSISWLITPRKTGSYELAVTDNLNTKIYGITVKNMFGLSAVQGKIASGIGTIFGPMLTIPWWWDRLRQKKKEEIKINNPS